jgi:hypothetical protein
MTTVTIVYVDPKGEVRMSPDGWPVMPKDIHPRDQYLKALDQYNECLKYDKEKSILFEDQSTIIKKLPPYRNLPSGLYTIDPVHVRMVRPLHKFPVARIVTEEEKPAPTKHRNPSVFLRDGELYAFVEDIRHVVFIDASDEDNDARIKQAVERAKASAIKVKNHDEVIRSLIGKGVLCLPTHTDSEPPYTLEGYQMEVEVGLCPCEESLSRGIAMMCFYCSGKKKLAIISPVERQESVPLQDVIIKMENFSPAKVSETASLASAYEANEQTFMAAYEKQNQTPPVVEQDVVLPTHHLFGLPEFNSPKSWPEDYEHESGKYMCKCCFCEQSFMGHKRRVVCKECDAIMDGLEEKIEFIKGAFQCYVGYKTTAGLIKFLSEAEFTIVRKQIK